MTSMDGINGRSLQTLPEGVITTRSDRIKFRLNKTHFLKKGCAPSLIMKVRVFGTRKWPIKIQNLKNKQHVIMPATGRIALFYS